MDSAASRNRDSLVSLAKALSSQCRGPEVDPWSGNWIPHAASESLCATSKDSTCRKEDQRSHVLQLKPNTAKEINVFLNVKKRK